MFKKTPHSLFVEEETYNWASPKSGMHKQLLLLGVMFVVAGLLFSTLS